MDGVPLVQVASAPAGGQFSVENGSIVIADNPQGRTVEVTTRPYWIIGGASGVTIQGFTMKHAGNPSHFGALHAQHSSNWTVRNNVLSDAHGAPVSFIHGSGFRLLDNDVSRGGGLGGGISHATDVLLQGNRFHHNNTEGFNPGWSAGGFKGALITGMVVEGNEFDSNDGPGFWCDVECSNVTIRHNRVHHNQWEGILYEISHYATIHGNAVWENGYGRAAWCFGGGIVLQNSDHVEVYGNTVAWNHNGISVISQNRGPAVSNIVETSIHDNTIVAGGPGRLAHGYCEDWAGVLFAPESHNRGANNGYWYPNPEDAYERFGWGNRGYARLADFNAASGSQHGRYLTASEKDQALAAAGIPTRR